MDVHVIDTLSGREVPLEIDVNATVATMKRRCGEAFGFGEDVELSVGGQRIACDGVECVSNVAAFSGGCRVGVVRGVAQFVAQLRSGAVKICDIPVWAQQRRECVLAVLARALKGKQGGGDAEDEEEEEEGGRLVPPHWVHPSLHDDKEVMLQFVRCDPNAFLRASPKLRSDADVVIAALEQDASMWQHVTDKHLQEQRSVAVVAVPHCANSAVWLSDKAFVLEALGNSAAWEGVSKALQQDKEVIMEALVHDKLDNFHQLSATLQQDKEVVMKALDHVTVRFNDLSEALQGDKEVVMSVLYSVKDFHQLSRALQEDKEVAMEALGYGAVRFNDLSETLRGDKEVVMEALALGKLDYFHQLSPALQVDKEIALEALRQGRVKFGHLSEVLRADKSFMMQAITAGPATYADITGPLRQDKDVALAAINETDFAFINMDPVMRDDLDVALAAIRVDPCAFVYAGDSVRADRRAALAAFTEDEVNNSNGIAPVLLLPFASAELQADPEVVLAAVRANPQNAVHASPALQDLGCKAPPCVPERRVVPGAWSGRGS